MNNPTGTPRPHSLRRRLMAWVMSAIVLAALLQASSAYRSALQQADAMFDYQLQQMAFLLRGGLPLPVPRLDADAHEGVDYVVQIWASDGTQIFQSNRYALPPRAVLGFSEQGQGGTRYRVYSLQTPHQTIQIAQDMRAREDRARSLALRAMLPMAVMGPLLMLLLWWVIRHSLAPLERTRAQVATRMMDDLAPLPADTLPEEVRPLVQEINLLFGRLHQAYDAQRAFVANAAHELRSPLTALKLQVQALERPLQPEARAQAIARLHQGMDRAIRLLQQMLVLARQESQGEPKAASAVQVALPEVVQQAVEEMLPLAQERGIDLGVSHNTPASVYGDADALRILLRNLLENALKYTPVGGQVDVSIDNTPQGPSLVVEDSGPGIPADERGQVFERFVRGSDAQATGSGLGLSIVRAIAERHQADIQLDDAPALGGLRVRVQFQTAAEIPTKG